MIVGYVIKKLSFPRHTTRISKSACLWSGFVVWAGGGGAGDALACASLLLAARADMIDIAMTYHRLA
jgi:hypothetical protein